MNPTRCRHLRTKKMYTVAYPDEAFSEKDTEQASPSHFWCNLTQSVVGPDDGQAHPGTCKPGRACYED
jgi:hypothetical protein